MDAGLLSAETFARLIARLGPFERNPVVAVAVSGGSDSMALTLLLAEWAAARGGRVEAITVDHGLRPESAAEAAQVGAWLANRPAVRHRILTWTGPKPKTGVQAAARAARYRLLGDWCRAEAILHLCLAHHLDDQVETAEMRRKRGSGVVGLAGMSAIREWNGVRLLRPLLGVPKAALAATLRARRQDWIEDPSNRDASFERTHLRAIAGRRDVGVDLAALHRAGLERQRMEGEAAAVLAESLRIDSAGWASVAVDGGGLAAEAPAAILAFGSLLQSVGGAEYPVDETRRRQALTALRRDDWPGFTLGGCHLFRHRGRLTICRDWGSAQDCRPVQPGDRLTWDRRFAACLAADLPDGVTIARLGEDGIQWLGRAGWSNENAAPGHHVPEPARKALPAAWRGKTLIAVPALGYGGGMAAAFRPELPATSSGFTVAY